jgi:hypothetical protein
MGGGSGGGGGGPTQSTSYQTNLPEYARPYVETMLGAAQKQLFTTKETGATPEVRTQVGVDESGQPIYNVTPGRAATTEVTGFKPYIPYGATVDAAGNITNTAQEQAAAAVAGFSPMQEQAFRNVANLQVPGQFGAGSQLAEAAGYGSLMAARQAQPLMREALGYGAEGAGYGGMAAGMSGMGFGAGRRFEQMATSPGAQQAFMSPYMQNVVEYQKQQAIRDYDIASQGRNAAAVRAGAFGGSRQAVAEAEANRALMSQLGGIQATGAQKAFEDAQRQMQFGSQLGLQGLQAGYQGLGMGIQGAQAGMQGIGQAIGAGQYGLAGLGQATQAGQALGQLGGQQLQAQQGIIGLQSQVGAQQQALEQQRVNQAIQNYAMQQQYPQQQLATMSSLLRGLPLQQATTQSYQAPPSAISQIGGLGTAGIGAYGLGRAAGIFKKGGKVKASDGLAELGLYNAMSKAG